ncbi:unnamed protein product [Discula destructiva]
MVLDNKENVDPKASGQEEVIPDLPPNYAVAFDIDGVLVRGKIPIETAKCSLAFLKQNNIPYIMLTNGGGHTEAAHATMLAARLGIEVDEEQFVQSHTPYKSFLHAYEGQWVLCLGGEKANIKALATAYEFTADKVLSTSDLVKQDPKIHPFSEMTLAHHQEHGKIKPSFTPDQRIAAIFVFSSPRDWVIDIQVCLDLLASEGGRLGTRSSLNGKSDMLNHGYQQDGQPQLYFCNPDLEWATSYPQPRLAQGAFRAALEGVWNQFTNNNAPLQAWTCGKPTTTTFKYAETAIHRYRNKINNPGSEMPDLRTIYMIGDNQYSDISGANAASKTSQMEWKSVLVESGVYKPGTDLEHVPTTIKADVWEAVKWIIQQEQKE